MWIKYILNRHLKYKHWSYEILHIKGKTEKQGKQMGIPLKIKWKYLGKSKETKMYMWNLTQF